VAVLVEQAARALGPDDFDIEILEMHHRHKVTRPPARRCSWRGGRAGAASRLPATTCACATATPARARRARSASPRLRGGSVVGDHSVMLAGTGERITLAHHAEDRAIFARGAVKAALGPGTRNPPLFDAGRARAGLSLAGKPEGRKNDADPRARAPRPERMEPEELVHRLRDVDLTEQGHAEAGPPARS